LKLETQQIRPGRLNIANLRRVEPPTAPEPALRLVERRQEQESEQIPDACGSCDQGYNCHICQHGLKEPIGQVKKYLDAEREQAVAALFYRFKTALAKTKTADIQSAEYDEIMAVVMPDILALDQAEIAIFNRLFKQHFNRTGG